MLRTYQPKKIQRKKEHGFQENEDRKRPQGSLPPQSKGQSQAQLLRHTREQVKREYFQGGVIRPLGVCTDLIRRTGRRDRWTAETP